MLWRPLWLWWSVCDRKFDKKHMHSCWWFCSDVGDNCMMGDLRQMWGELNKSWKIQAWVWRCGDGRTCYGRMSKRHNDGIKASHRIILLMFKSIIVIWLKIQVTGMDAVSTKVVPSTLCGTLTGQHSEHRHHRHRRHCHCHCRRCHQPAL